MASVVTFGQLLEEETDFLAFIHKTGDVWARAVSDEVESPKCEPLPVAEFLMRFAGELQTNFSVNVYIGLRGDVLHPEICSHEVTEGGTEVPFVQNGSIVQGIRTLVGGRKVRRKFIDPMASRLVRYDRGTFRSVDELASSNLCFYPGVFRGEAWIAHPASFMKGSKKILDWMRRHTPESVPVYQCNYEMRATVRVAEACKKGLKLR
jgi:hypothetical protein